jgi:hypothetical protein
MRWWRLRLGHKRAFEQTVHAVASQTKSQTATHLQARAFHARLLLVCGLHHSNRQPVRLSPRRHLMKSVRSRGIATLDRSPGAWQATCPGTSVDTLWALPDSSIPKTLGENAAAPDFPFGPDLRIILDIRGGRIFLRGEWKPGDMASQGIKRC